MCLNPHKIAEIGFVACRECWQCRERKIDDWVGRCIAESKTATASHAVTLTYGEDLSTGAADHERAAVLTYSDVQKYLKYLRVDGYPVRYFAIGEYGSMKGRAHWHIILYWQAAVPEHEIAKRFMQKHWPHGWSHWEPISAASIRYNCKYIQKDMGDDVRQGHMSMSKKPPLGDEYFRQLAAKYVQAGLSPQDLFYSFPEVTRVPHGTRGKTAKQFREAAKPIKFLMSGKTAENYVRYFIEEWEKQHGGEPPKSELIWDFYDKGLDMTKEQRTKWAQEHGFTPNQEKFTGHVPVPSVKPKNWSRPTFDQVRNCFVSKCPTFGQILLYGKSSEGIIQWHLKGVATALPLEAIEKRLPRIPRYREASGRF